MKAGGIADSPHESSRTVPKIVTRRMKELKCAN